jgi:hypothetical protein
MRRVVLLGRFPDALKTRLINDYGVHIVLDGETLQHYMVPTLESREFDLVIVDQRLKKADRIVEAARQTGRIAVKVNPARGAQGVIERMAAVTDWGVGGKTVFVVVTSTKGGVGKTTVAGALAVMLAEEGYPVLAVDDNPHQRNMVRFLTDEQVTIMPPEDIKGARIKPNIVTIEPRIDLLAPDTYIESGVTFGAAKRFWRKVRSHPYDYVVVDTSPGIPTPDAPGDWTETYLTYVLLTGAFPAVYVVPFTPVEWGCEGMERTRDVLKRWNQLDWMLPVVTATDRDHVLENIPSWLQRNGWHNRLVAIPYSRGIQTEPRISYLRKCSLFHRPKVPYRPLVQKVMLLAHRRQEQAVRGRSALAQRDH